MVAKVILFLYLLPGLYSVGNKARKLNKICSGNLHSFSQESIKEYILATTNVSRLGEKVSIFSQHFKIVYTDHLKAHLS